MKWRVSSQDVYSFLEVGFFVLSMIMLVLESRGRAGRGRCNPSLFSIASHSLFFFCRYVYIPLGGSQHGRLGTLLSTATTFAFVSYWHGSYEDLWCWAALNWLGVTVESGVRRLLETPCVRETLVSMIHHCLCGRGQLSKEGLV